MGMLLRMSGGPRRPAAGVGQRGQSIGNTLGEIGLTTAAKSKRIVAELPGPVKLAIRELAIYVRFGNVLVGAKLRGVYGGAMEDNE